MWVEEIWMQGRDLCHIVNVGIITGAKVIWGSQWTKSQKWPSNDIANQRKDFFFFLEEGVKWNTWGDITYLWLLPWQMQKTKEKWVTHVERDTGSGQESQDSSQDVMGTLACNQPDEKSGYVQKPRSQEFQKGKTMFDSRSWGNSAGWEWGQKWEKDKVEGSVRWPQWVAAVWGDDCQVGHGSSRRTVTLHPLWLPHEVILGSAPGPSVRQTLVG